MKLTPKQTEALRFLAGVPWASPAAIGYAINNRSPPLKAQGAGRLGGTMVWRLRARGLVSIHERGGGWTAYTITPAGRQALSALTDEGENHE